MSFCPEDNFLLDESETIIFIISTTTAMALTSFGSYKMIHACRKLEHNIIISYLICWAAIWDILYGLGNYLFLMFSYVNQSYEICFLNYIHFATGFYSQACICLTFLTYFINSRHQQKKFEDTYKFWLIGFYIFGSAFYFIFYYLYIQDNFESIIGIYAPGTALFAVSLYGSIRLYMTLYCYGIEKAEKSPFLYLGGISIYYGIMFFFDTMLDGNHVQTAYILSRSCVIGVGFANFVLGYTRLKPMFRDSILRISNLPLDLEKPLHTASELEVEKFLEKELLD